MVLIDKLKIDDLEGLKEVYEEGFEGSNSDLSRMLETFEAIKDNPDYYILVATTDGKVVGTVMGVVCYELFGKCLPFMVVENIAILNDYRRQGIAKQLLVKLEEHANERKCNMILFVSSAHRTGAHKLYESLGYGIDKVNGYRKRL